MVFNKIIPPNKKATFVQNFLLLGTIKENQQQYNQIADLLEKAGEYALARYSQYNGNLKMYHRIAPLQSNFIVLSIKEGAKNNPYFAIVDIKNPVKVNFEADVETLKPLCKDGMLSVLCDEIDKAFEYERSLNKIDEQIMEYIDEYDRLIQ